MRPVQPFSKPWPLVLYAASHIFLVTATHAQEQPPTISAPTNTAADLRRPLPPLVVPDSVTVEKDITYARYGTREMKLDLYRPSHGAGLFPGVVFIHGGAWTMGGKADFSHQAVYLAGKGYVCVSIEYRLSKEAPYPAALYDSKAAVRWLRAHAKVYNVDSNKIAAVGGSSGGQLAAMLGTTSDARTMEGDGGNEGISSRVQGDGRAFNRLTDFVSMLAKTQNLAAATKAIVPYLGDVHCSGTGDLCRQFSPARHVSRYLLHFCFCTVRPIRRCLMSNRWKWRPALHGRWHPRELYRAKDADHGFFNLPRLISIIDAWNSF